MSQVLQPIFHIFILVLIGAGCRHWRVMDAQGHKQLTNLVFNLVLPCMLFTSAVRTDFQEIGGQAAIAFLAGLLVPLPAFVIGQVAGWLGQVSEPRQQVIRVSTALANTAFFGIPVCAALWGEQGALLAGFYDLGITIPMFILGPLGYAVRPNWRNLAKAFVNPIVIGMSAGIAINLLGIRIPEALLAPVALVGSMTTPLALILVGMMLDVSSLRRVEVPPLLVLASSRLLVVPLVIWLIVVLLGLEKGTQQVIVMQSAMPASVLGTLMAFEYHSDGEFAVQGNLTTVVLSIVTLSLFAVWIS